MRSRTLGNSNASVMRRIEEYHNEGSPKGHLQYLGDYESYRSERKDLRLDVAECRPPPPLQMVASPKWRLATYVRDMYVRLEGLKSKLTDVYGEILKMDSTKKLAKKLSGKCKQSAAWVTNIGNEHGQVLISVFTESESTDGLHEMAKGLTQRYQKAKVEQPKVLYVDRGCCTSTSMPSSIKQLFLNLPNLVVRMNIYYHFMRRIASGCTSENHPLYGCSMASLSFSIYEWDPSDLDALYKAKKEDFVQNGGTNADNYDPEKHVMKQELARHCRRTARNSEETKEVISQLLETFKSARDSLGAPLQRPEIDAIWKEQAKHYNCISDPDSVKLYRIVQTLQKGDTQLPVYRCARSSKLARLY